MEGLLLEHFNVGGGIFKILSLFLICHRKIFLCLLARGHLTERYTIFRTHHAEHFWTTHIQQLRANDRCFLKKFKLMFFASNIICKLARFVALVPSIMIPPNGLILHNTMAADSFPNFWLVPTPLAFQRNLQTSLDRRKIVALLFPWRFHASYPHRPCQKWVVHTGVL